MADLQTQRRDELVEDEYSTWEVVFWIIGILMIPLAPILMVLFLTPWSGMGPR